MALNVLIADDSRLARDIIRATLESAGHRVVGEAATGGEAVDLYRELKPEVATVDEMMPDMRGLEALRRILALDPEARVIMVSAIGHELFAAEATEVGARGVVPKPFKPDELLTVVDRVARK